MPRGSQNRGNLLKHHSGSDGRRIPLPRNGQERDAKARKGRATIMILGFSRIVTIATIIFFCTGLLLVIWCLCVVAAKAEREQ